MEALQFLNGKKLWKMVSKLLLSPSNRNCLAMSLVRSPPKNSIVTSYYICGIIVTAKTSKTFKSSKTILQLTNFDRRILIPS